MQGPPDPCPRPACISTGRPVSCPVLSEGGHLPRALARCGQGEPTAAVLRLTRQRLSVGRDGAQRRLRGYSGASGPPHPLTLHVRLRGPLCCLPASRAGVRPHLWCCSWGGPVGLLGQHACRPWWCRAGVCCPLVAAPTFGSVSEPPASRAAPPHPPTRPSRTGWTRTSAPARGEAGGGGAGVAVWSLGSRQVRRALGPPGGNGGPAWRGILTSQGRTMFLPGSAWPGTEPSRWAVGRCTLSLLAGCGPCQARWPVQQEGLPWADGRLPHASVSPGPRRAAGSVLGSAFGSVAVAARVSAGPRRAATWGSGTRRRLRGETSTS